MPTPRELPERFGRYRILRQLGAGGRGHVRSVKGLAAKRPRGRKRTQKGRGLDS